MIEIDFWWINIGYLQSRLVLFQNFFFVELYNVLLIGSVDKEPPLIIYTHLPSSLFPAVKIKNVI